MRPSLRLLSMNRHVTSPKLLSSLSGLTATKLKDIAIAVGTAVSGKKSDLVASIKDRIECSDIPLRKPGEGLGKKMRIVSIDMGIRNLAFACITLPTTWAQKQDFSNGSGSLPVLEAWKRLAMTSESTRNSAITTPGEPDSNSSAKITVPKIPAESFDPTTLSTTSLNFANQILSAYKPTHILIERQRFRSAGGSAVLEWSLRVGVFEGMLHSTFKTLASERGLGLEVGSIDPGKVSRFWMKMMAKEGEEVGKDVKKFKIEIAGRCLEVSDPAVLELCGEEVKDVVKAFLARSAGGKAGPSTSGRRSPRSPPEKGEKIRKLDDMADALLSALTWLEWRKAIWELRREDDVDLGKVVEDSFNLRQTLQKAQIDEKG